MNGKDFLGTARFLLSKGTCEADYRTVVSRAYYACFLEFRQAAFDNCAGPTRTKGGVPTVRDIRHRELLRYLKDSASAAVRHLGTDLSTLYGSREEADYNMALAMSLKESQDAVQYADDLLLSLSQMHAREIGKAMSLYINKTCKP